MPETPAPTVPPTPPVPLSALLAREDLGLRLVAGPAGPDVMIHGAHASEMADPYPYLLGGELLLSAGVHLPGAGGSEDAEDAEEAEGAGACAEYVGRVVAAGGAALGFGVAPVHDRVPEALVAACDAYGLPLVEVPPRTPFAAVGRAVWQLMAQARLAELRRVTEAQQSLAAAASRPDPVPAVLRQLARRVGGRAELYGPDGTRLAAAGREPDAGAARALAALSAVVRPGGGTPGPTPASATDTAGGAQLAAYALGGQGYALGVATARRDPGDHTIASVAAVLLSLLTGPGPAEPAGTGTGTGVGYGGTGADRSAALVRLLLGAAPGEVAPLLGGERWVVVHARPVEVRSVEAPRSPDRPDAVVAPVPLGTTAATDRPGSARTPGPPPAPDPSDATRATDATDAPVSPAFGAAALGAALGSALVDPGAGSRAGAESECGPERGTGRDGGAPVRVLVPADRPVTAQPGWVCGVSAPAGPGEWAAADLQAARALARARATRVTLVRHSERPALAELVPAEDAVAHARALLAPLDGRPALADTLRAWLSLHGSWDRTAVALSVHRNTVRQRIARCAVLLEADLDDPDVRMELWFALRQGR